MDKTDIRKSVMPIKRVGDFYVSEDLVRVPDISSIGIESSIIDSVIQEASGKYISIFGADYFGFFEENMDFLGQLKNVEHIWFWGVNLKSIDGIYALNNLRSMGIFGKYPKIDFSKLVNLESLVWEYKRRDTGISSLVNLKSLSLWHYKPTCKSFNELHLPACIEKLVLNWVNPCGINGLPTLEKLKHIEIHQSRNLTSISGISNIAPNLESIIVTATNKLIDLEELKELKYLKSAKINGNVLV